MGVGDDKRALRARLRQARRETSPPPGSAAWRARAAAVADAVLADPGVAAAVRGRAAVAAYAATRTEPPTDVLRERLRAAGVRVLLPVVVDGTGAASDGVLAWADDEGPGATLPDRRGLPTPTGARVGVGAAALLAAGVRVVVVPALAVADDGRRIGQGGGYYDRLLAGLPRVAAGGPLRLAVVGPGEVLAAANLPAEEHDAPVDRWVVA